jgi:hypothetical protein
MGYAKTTSSVLEGHYISLWESLLQIQSQSGQWDKYLAEFIAAQSLLKLTLLKGAHSLHIYEDSMPIIKYVSNERGVHSITLQALGKQLKEKTQQITKMKITFIHVYRVLNSEADTLSRVLFWEVVNYFCRSTWMEL